MKSNTMLLLAVVAALIIGIILFIIIDSYRNGSLTPAIAALGDVLNSLH